MGDLKYRGWILTLVYIAQYGVNREVFLTLQVKYSMLCDRQRLCWSLALLWSQTNINHSPNLYMTLWSLTFILNPVLTRLHPLAETPEQVARHEVPQRFRSPSLCRGGAGGPGEGGLHRVWAVLREEGAPASSAAPPLPSSSSSPSSSSCAGPPSHQEPAGSAYRRRSSVYTMTRYDCGIGPLSTTWDWIKQPMMWGSEKALKTDPGLEPIVQLLLARN